MRLWIDLANSPHVPFFKALAARFVERGHEIEITARDFAETVPLAKAADFRRKSLAHMADDRCRPKPEI